MPYPENYFTTASVILITAFNTKLVSDLMQGQHGSSQEKRFPTLFVAIAAVAIAFVVVLILVLSYFSSKYSYYEYPYGWWGIMGVMMLFMVPIMIIVLIAIAYVVYRGFRWGGYGRYGSDEEKETAMEILRRRYASGEISKEQYEQLKRDIS